MRQAEKTMTAAEVRAAEGLPEDGRGVLSRVGIMETLFREAVAPATAIYDMAPGSHIVYHDYSYTEGLGLFLCKTLSAEINARIVLEAARGTFAGEPRIRAVAEALEDKWARPGADPSPWMPVPDMQADGVGKKILFYPGRNMDYLVNHPYAEGAFGMDRAWWLKPHPISGNDEDFVMDAAVRYGAKARTFHPWASGIALLRRADEVGYTTASELGLIAMVLGIKAHDFSRYAYEAWGNYYPLYRAVRDAEASAEETLDTILACEWSGVVALDTPPAEAAERFAAFRRKAERLRAELEPRAILNPRPQDMRQTRS